MTDTGHRTITTVRHVDGSLTNDPASVLQATQDSFFHQHTPIQDTLDMDTQNEVDRPPQVFNHAQRRQLGKRPFTIHEVRKAIHSLWQHKTPGYDALPAEAYYHFPSHLLRIRPNDSGTSSRGQPPCHQTGRAIVCAVTEVKIVWTILLRRICPHLERHIPASLWVPSRAGPHTRPSSSRTPSPTWTR